LNEFDLIVIDLLLMINREIEVDIDILKEECGWMLVVGCQGKDKVRFDSFNFNLQFDSISRDQA
jgi:hypothetical protein